MREYFNRVTNFTVPPKNLCEGAIKGFVGSSVAASVFVMFPFGDPFDDPYFAKFILTFLVACTLIGTGWGLYNQLQPNDDVGARAYNRRMRSIG